MEGVGSLLPGVSSAQCSLYLKGVHREDRGSLFTGRHMEKTRGNRYKLHRERFPLSIRGKFFTVRTIIHWNNFPIDAGESTSLGVFKM